MEKIPRRVFVRVLVEFDADGKVTPLEIAWPDGRLFKVDRLIDVRKAAARSGGSGMRYLCRIQGHEIPLYQDFTDGRWWCDGKN